MARNKRHVPPTSTQDQKRKRSVIIFSLFMIFLMVFSFASVILYNPASSEYQMDYGEYEFELEQRANGGSVLVAEFNGEPIEFQNLPVQVRYVPVDPAAISLLKNAQQLALAADPILDVQAASLVDYARLQLTLAIPGAFSAMTQESAALQLPVLTCAHSSTQMPVLLFNVTNETGSVTVDGTCILLNGNNQDMMRLKDRLIFEYYDILQNGEIVE